MTLVATQNSKIQFQHPVNAAIQLL